MTSRSQRMAKRCRAASERSFRHFCKNTSIHGVHYIVDHEAHWIERVAWVLVVIAGLCFSGYFCWQMWQKWEESPVLTSIDTNHYPLNEVDFPAVTICNVNKVSKRKLVEVLSQPKFESVSYDLMLNTLRYMTKLDRAIMNDDELKNLSRFYQSANISPNDLFAILKRAAPSCEDLIMDCSWLGLPKSCLDYFSFLPTDDGICCTFNGANYSDPELGIESNPREILRVNGNGYRMGLALVLNADVEDYSVTNGKFDGFKVLVHSPEEFPDVSDRGFVIGPGAETFVGIKSTLTFSSEDLSTAVPPNKRQCRMEGEKKLKYFTTYSRSACEVECAIGLMQNHCQCRPYFFRDKGVPLCSLDSYPCLSDVYERVRQLGNDLCDCLAPCSETWYDPEISQAPFPGRGFNLTRTFKRLVEELHLDPQIDQTDHFRSNVAVLHVYYKEKTGMRYKTDVRFGVEDFISAMGGLLGLGLGFSFISIVEIIYFMFFRHHVRPLRERDLNDKMRNKSSWPSSNTVVTDTSAPSMSNLEMNPAGGSTSREGNI